MGDSSDVEAPRMCELEGQVAQSTNTDDRDASSGR